MEQNYPGNQIQLINFYGSNALLCGKILIFASAILFVLFIAIYSLLMYNAKKNNDIEQEEYIASYGKFVVLAGLICLSVLLAGIFIVSTFG